VTAVLQRRPMVLEAARHVGETSSAEAAEVLAGAAGYSSPFVDMPFVDMPFVDMPF
jgi:hypothetical protein